MTAPSPGIIATTMVNEYYDYYETYVFALARELRKEYELIASYGFLLQLDAPDFGLERARMFKNQSDAEFLHAMELNVEAINRATEGIPRDNSAARLLGQLGGPAHPRFPTRGTPALTLSSQGWCAEHRIRQSAAPARIPGAAKNPLPLEMILIPGVIDTTTNFVEHPEVVANRICEAVQTIGDRSRVIAGTDCGFGTSAGTEAVSSDVAWAKLAACREGADIATRRLWG